MKKTVALFIALIIVFIFSFHSFSADINLDGKDGGTEWLKAEMITPINGESHSGIDLAILKYFVDYETYDLWMCIMLRDKNMKPDDEDLKIIIFAENEEIEIKPSDGSVYANNAKYLLDAKSSVNLNGTTTEIRLGIKNGIPDEYKFRIRFADANGDLSNIKDVIIRKSVPSTTKEAETTKAEKKTEKSTTKKVTETTSRAERTTKEKTTKMRTTKATTVKVTTTASPVTSKPAKITKPAKTTKPGKSTTAKAQKNITEKPTAAQAFPIESTAPAMPNETTSAAINSSLSAAEKYKTIIFASGAAALILIASLSVLGAKKKEE